MLADLPVEVREGSAHDPVLPAPAEGITLSQAVALYERRMIEAALRRAGGIQRQAARELGLLPTTLNEKIKRLGLKPDAPAC
ncbi:MAG: helix-turn-helix domain-containing protein [Acidobacteriota bacterium]